MSKNNFGGLPLHIAIIPDGNRRWAKNKNLKPWRGHLEGAKRGEEISKAAIELGIKYLTLWGGSYDNLTKRSKQEIKVLEKIYAQMTKKLLKDKSIHKNKVRVRFIGEWPKLLSESTKKLFRKVEEMTKDYGDFNLTYLVGYNGDREMISVINRLVSAGVKINDEELKNNLWTKNLPPVDLIIRTGNEPHLSAGFLMWDTRYSELYFSQKMWPDFKKADIQLAIDYFSKRMRRLGA